MNDEKPAAQELKWMEPPAQEPKLKWMEPGDWKIEESLVPAAARLLE